MGAKLTALLVIVVLAVLAVAGYYLLNNPLWAKLMGQPPVQNDVLVSGMIKTGFTTSPSGINFTSQKTGQTSYTTVDKNGRYSITVLGNDTYNVTVYYSSLLGTSTSKNCKRALTLNSTVTAFNFSMSC